MFPVSIFVESDYLSEQKHRNEVEGFGTSKINTRLWQLKHCDIKLLLSVIEFGVLL